MLYATNRGGEHSSVAVFDVLEDGDLRQVRLIDAPSFPRGMTLARESSMLVVAGQQQGVVQTFKSATKHRGDLQWTGVNVTGPPTAAALAVITGPPTAAALA